MKSNKREDGFYWVLFCNKWNIAEWSNYWHGWTAPNAEGHYSDDLFTKIKERRIMPKEINLEAVKNAIASFSDKTFGNNRPYTAPLHHLKKEVMEAIKSGDIYEYSDMLLLLLDSFRKRFPGSHTDILLKASMKKIKICKKRKWEKPDKNGVIEHTR